MGLGPPPPSSPTLFPIKRQSFSPPSFRSPRYQIFQQLVTVLYLHSPTLPGGGS